METIITLVVWTLKGIFATFALIVGFWCAAVYFVFFMHFPRSVSFFVAGIACGGWGWFIFGPLTIVGIIVDFEAFPQMSESLNKLISKKEK